MNSDELARGKTKLDAAVYAADLSGKDFENVYLDASQTLSHSFLNGSSFKNSAFIGAPIDQTELAEAEISGCHFHKVDLNGSSFIGAKVENTIFDGCNFTDGEWRKSRFRDVTFTECDFNYTTMNLCTFDRCSFSGEGSKRLDNRSVNYNVFTRSQFGFVVEDDVVLASNFGMPSGGKTQSLAKYGSSTSLEEICLKSAAGKIVISELIDAIRNEFGKANGHRLKVLRLEFVSNIIVALATISKISATSLVYLENFFSALARSSEFENDALAAMSVLLNIRNLLVGISENGNSESEYADAVCRAIDVRYERTYSRADAEELAKILGELAHDNPGTFSVTRFANGSTLIDLVALQAVGIGAALMAINFALRQANVTLVRVREIRSNAEMLLKELSPGKKRRKRSASRVPALQRSGAPTKEIASLRRTVADHGYRAVSLDDEAEVTLHYVSNK